MYAPSSSRTSSSRSAESGFTLIELLAVIIVGGVLLAALTTFYLTEQRAFRQQQIQIETSQALRVALEQIVRDLRVAGRDPTGTSGANFVRAEATRVEFTIDADGNGGITNTDRAEYKGFRLQNGEIRVYVADAPVDPWQPVLASYVDPATTTIFTYYDANNVQIPTPITGATLANIRRVDVVLTMTNRVPGGGEVRRTEAATVRVRNLS